MGNCIRGIERNDYNIKLLEDIRIEEEIEIKNVVVVGDMYTGKTTIVKILTGNANRMIEEYKPTIGVELYTMYLRKEMRGIEKNRKLNIWDYGMNSRYRIYEAGEIVKVDILILMINISNQDIDREIKLWINEIEKIYIKHRKGNMRAIIIGNIMDEDGYITKSYDEIITTIENTSRTGLRIEYMEISSNMRIEVIQEEMYNRLI